MGTSEVTREGLDASIRHWRARRDASKDAKHRETCVDNLQELRHTRKEKFGDPLLPEERAEVRDTFLAPEAPCAVPVTEGPESDPEAADRDEFERDVRLEAEALKREYKERLGLCLVPNSFAFVLGLIARLRVGLANVCAKDIANEIVARVNDTLGPEAAEELSEEPLPTPEEAATEPIEAFLDYAADIAQDFRAQIEEGGSRASMVIPSDIDEFEARLCEAVEARRAEMSKAVPFDSVLLVQAARHFLEGLIERHGIKSVDDFNCPHVRDLFDVLEAMGEEPGIPMTVAAEQAPQTEALRKMLNARSPEEVEQAQAEYEEAFRVEPESPSEQITRLADFIMHEVPSEPSESQGAVDTAIRLLRTWGNLPKAFRVKPDTQEAEKPPVPFWKRKNAPHLEVGDQLRGPRDRTYTFDPDVVGGLVDVTDQLKAVPEETVEALEFD